MLHASCRDVGELVLSSTIQFRKGWLRTMGSPSKKRTTAKELAERIREIEERLAASVPKAEFEAAKSSLQSEIDDLKAKLSGAESPKPELSEYPGNGQLKPEPSIDEPQRVERMRGENGFGPTITETVSQTEDHANDEAEDSESTDPEDAEESEEPESTESSV